ncbi:MAG: type I DNA topoisomerase [Catonella sp.]|nr:type I DNA topoisomerase [Catonella sp.]MDY6356190.1 type I DNA topoisomerase [Catonella sp.]
MAKYLVIVESPAKAKTIGRFLGSNYKVTASMGHVRDLPKSQMGIDIENDFEPKYITIRGKGDLLAELRKEVKKADKVYLATDPDREGEAISWHLVAALKLEDKNYQRVTFNEITKNTVKASMKEPREIDMDLVDAQQARRVMDRIVGYSISPLLWAKVKRGLSAGRVQSVALRIICDREKLINDFIPEEYWSLDALLLPDKEKKPLTFHFYGNADGKKMALKSASDVDKVLNGLKGAKFGVKEIKDSVRTRKSPLPFTTSTLQQEASKALNFSTSKTMRIAQQLYEGVEVKGQGTVGLISYLRTDSTRISEEADAAARAFIKDNYGENFVAPKAAEAGKKQTARIQDAHEAIRPTMVELTPAMVKDDLSRDQARLYGLIWKRFVASRMSAAKSNVQTVKITAGDYMFTGSASKLAFDGFMSVYTNDENKKEPDTLNYEVKESTKLTLQDYDKEQHFTQPPAHFTEASLVKTLEELGIGRPSTYAPTISTILARRYVVKEQKNLFVTEMGEAVNKIMNDEFPEIVDVNFTATMESLLDGVEKGEINWKEVVRNFYPDLKEEVDKANEELEKIEIKDEVSEEICPNCGRNLVVKYGPHGKFLACPGFPDCKFTKPYLERTGITCPKCGGEVVIKKTQKGRKFYGCDRYPECDFVSWQRPSNTKCPKCGGYMVVKGKNLVCADRECGTVIPLPEGDEAFA